MTKAIEQSVGSPRRRTSCSKCISIRRNILPRQAVAAMSRKVGGAFTAWNGQLSGRNLLIVPEPADRAGVAQCEFQEG